MLYTYADYLEWDEGYRAELINGEVFEMGAPTITAINKDWDLP